METLQVEWELEQMMALYRGRRPQRVLEIGVWQGGTLKGWLEESTDGARIVAVDLAHTHSELYESWRRTGTRLSAVRGSSHDPEVIDEVTRRGPYSWIFVDGDHSFEAVQEDVRTYLPLVAPGGLFLMHDIVGPTGEKYPPGLVLDTIEAYSIGKIISPEPSDVSHGVGIVYC